MQKRKNKIGIGIIALTAIFLFTVMIAVGVGNQDKDKIAEAAVPLASSSDFTSIIGAQKVGMGWISDTYVLTGGTGTFKCDSPAQNVSTGTRIKGTAATWNAWNTWITLSGDLASAADSGNIYLEWSANYYAPASVTAAGCYIGFFSGTSAISSNLSNNLTAQYHANAATGSSSVYDTYTGGSSLTGRYIMFYFNIDDKISSSGYNCYIENVTLSFYYCKTVSSVSYTSTAEKYINAGTSAYLITGGTSAFECDSSSQNQSSGKVMQGTSNNWNSFNTWLDMGEAVDTALSQGRITVQWSAAYYAPASTAVRCNIGVGSGASSPTPNFSNALYTCYYNSTPVIALNTVFSGTITPSGRYLMLYANFSGSSSAYLKDIRFKIICANISRASDYTTNVKDSNLAIGWKDTITVSGGVSAFECDTPSQNISSGTVIKSSSTTSNVWNTRFVLNDVSGYAGLGTLADAGQITANWSVDYRTSGAKIAQCNLGMISSQSEIPSEFGNNLYKVYHENTEGTGSDFTETYTGTCVLNGRYVLMYFYMYDSADQKNGYFDRFSVTFSRSSTYITASNCISSIAPDVTANNWQKVYTVTGGSGASSAFKCDLDSQNISNGTTIRGTASTWNTFGTWMDLGGAIGTLADAGKITIKWVVDFYSGGASNYSDSLYLYMYSSSTGRHPLDTANKQGTCYATNTNTAYGSVNTTFTGVHVATGRYLFMYFNPCDAFTTQDSILKNFSISISCPSESSPIINAQNKAYTPSQNVTIEDNISLYSTSVLYSSAFSASPSDTFKNLSYTYAQKSDTIIFSSFGSYSVRIYDYWGNSAESLIYYYNPQITAKALLQETNTPTAGTIKIDSGDASSSISATGKTVGENYILSVNNTENGYYFSHWEIIGGASNGATYSTETLNYILSAADTVSPSITFNAVWYPNIYTVALDAQDAASAGTAAIYEKYSFGYYIDSAAYSYLMTSAVNPITLPEKSYYNFCGYFTETGCGGAKYIDSEGHITSSASTTNFLAPGTLYAGWSPIEYNITWVHPDYTPSNIPDTSYTIEDTAVIAPDIIETGYSLAWTATETSGGRESGGWSMSEGAYSGGTLSISDCYGDITLIALWTINQYAITFSKGNYITDIFVATQNTAMSGAVSGAQYDYGTTVYIILTLEADSAQYDYSAPLGYSEGSPGYYYKQYTISTSNTQGIIDALRELKNYDVSFISNNESFGAVSIAKIDNVDYGTAISVIDNKITINGTTVTATQTASNAQYTYAFYAWSVSNNDTVTGPLTVTATFTQALNSYTVNIISNNADFGVVNVHKIDNVDYGTAISVIDNKITLNGTTATAAATTSNAQYTYAFYSWSVANNGIVTGPLTVTATFTQTLNSYAVNIISNNADFGAVNIAKVDNVNYGTAITVIDNKITINDTTVTATATASNAQYTYAFYSWSVANNDIVTGTLTVTATFTQALNSYTVNIISNNADFGVVNVHKIDNVYYGTAISVIDNTITINDTTVTATVTASNAQYTYAFYSWSVANNDIVTGTLTVTATFTQTLNSFTVNIISNNADFGAVNIAKVDNVDYGTAITVIDNIITINDTTVTATATTSNAQYTYAFYSWSVANNDTVTGPLTVTATFTQALNSYTVNIVSNNTDFGVVDVQKIDNVDYGTLITVSDNIITVNGTTVTATTTASNAQYTYAFYSWSVSNNDIVMGTLTVTATFTQTLNSYTVNIVSNNTDFGTVNIDKIDNVDYGTALTVIDNQITINGITVSAAAAVSDAQYTYAFSAWSVSNNDTVAGTITVTATFTQTVNCYTVNIVSGNTDFGIVNIDKINNIPYGTAIAVIGNMITVGGTTVSALAASSTAQYTYAFSFWSIENNDTVTGTLTVTATFTKTLNNYTVNIVSNNNDYGTVDVEKISEVDYGTAIAVAGNKITINGITVAATAAISNAQYTYAFSYWSVENNDTVKGTLTVTATFIRTLNRYNVNIISANGDYGTVSVSSISSVEYGATIEVNANTLMIGRKMVTANAKTSNAQYTYAFDCWNVANNDTVTGPLTITATFTETLNSYNVDIVSNNIAYGRVDIAKIIDVFYGTAIAVADNQITINGTTVTGTATTSNAQYTYAFNSWSVSNNDTLVGNLTITATFTETLNSYCININSNNTDFGTVDIAKIDDVNYGTAITVTDNTITINGIAITATAIAANPQYTYTFGSWSIANNDTVTGNLTITATFIRTLNSYKINFVSTDIGYGTVDMDCIENIGYGTSVKIIDNTVTINGIMVTAIATISNAQYTYIFSAWSAADNDIVTGDMTIYASFTRSLNKYTVYVESNNTAYGTVNTAIIENVEYGTVINVSGNTLSVRAATVTATARQRTLVDFFMFTSWSVSSNETVTGDITITAVFIRRDNKYIASININTIDSCEYSGQAVSAGSSDADIIFDYVGDGDISIVWYLDDNGFKGAMLGSAPINAGIYWIGISAEEGETYEAAKEVNQKFVISRSPLTIAANNVVQVFGDEEVPLGYKITSGRLYGEDILSGGLARVSGNMPGDYEINRGTLGSANYVISFINGVYSITKRPLTVSANAVESIYGNNEAALTFEAANLVEGYALYGSVKRAKGFAAGVYEITTDTITNKNNPCYDITFISANYTIKPRPIEIKADDQITYENTAIKTLTWTYAEGSQKFLEADGNKLIVLHHDGESNHKPGTYAITGSCLNPNYVVKVNQGVYTIKANIYYYYKFYNEIQNGGDYALIKTEEYAGTENEKIACSPIVDKYNGFIYNAAKSNTELTLVYNTSENERTIHLYYDRIKYTVTVTTGSGSQNTSESYVNYGDTIQLSEQNREGYYFVGWTVNGKKLYSDNVTITADMTIEAEWKLKKIYLIWNCDGGTPLEKYSFDYGESQECELPEPTKKGYIFEGWYFDKACTQKVDLTGKTAVENMTVYAKWEQDKKFNTLLILSIVGGIIVFIGFVVLAVKLSNR